MLSRFRILTPYAAALAMAALTSCTHFLTPPSPGPVVHAPNGRGDAQITGFVATAVPTGGETISRPMAIGVSGYSAYTDHVYATLASGITYGSSKARTIEDVSMGLFSASIMPGIGTYSQGRLSFSSGLHLPLIYSSFTSKYEGAEQNYNRDFEANLMASLGMTFRAYEGDLSYFHLFLGAALQTNLFYSSRIKRSNDFEDAPVVDGTTTQSGSRIDEVTGLSLDAGTRVGFGRVAAYAQLGLAFINDFQPHFGAFPTSGPESVSLSLGLTYKLRR